MREEHLGLLIASYQDSQDYAVWYNFENKGTLLAKIEHGDKTTFLEPGEKTTIKIDNYDLLIDQNALPHITMMNQGHPDA